MKMIGVLCLASDAYGWRGQFLRIIFLPLFLSNSSEKDFSVPTAGAIL